MLPRVTRRHAKCVFYRISDLNYYHICYGSNRCGPGHWAVQIALPPSFSLITKTKTSACIDSQLKPTDEYWTYCMSVCSSSSS